MSATTSTSSEPWGRLLVVGGTDFASLGRKDKAGGKLNSEARPDLPSPHFFRSVVNIKFKRVIASHSGCHAVALDIDNRAWLFGRNEHHQLSFPLPAAVTTPSLNASIDTPLAVGEPVLLNALPDANVPVALKSQTIIEAAVSRSHTVLVTNNGEVWTAGWNNLGQCGHPVAKEHVSSFSKVGGFPEGEKVIAATAGLSFSLFLCASGRVYSIGSAEKGQLGTGDPGERVANSKVFYREQREPVNVTGAIKNKKIVQIVSGQQSSCALDSEGFAYSWGFGGFGRLGLGKQFDCMFPTLIPHYGNAPVIARAARLASGGTHLMIIDGLGMLSLVGKWKTSGDGSSGQPAMFPKLVQDIQGYQFQNATAGGVTLFASSYDKKEGDFVVAWGQSATNGELGLGEGALKSATRPTRVESLDGITLLDMSAGQNSTFFIARPPPTPTETSDAIKTTTIASEAAALAPAAVVPNIGSGGVDLSGFGFDFGPPVAKASVIPVISTYLTEAAKAGISRTNVEKWEALPRWPELGQVGEECVICGREGEQDALECEKCERAFHGTCLNPPLYDVPEGEWFCHKCLASAQTVTVTDRDLEMFRSVAAANIANAAKRKADAAAPRSKKKKVQ